MHLDVVELRRFYTSTHLGRMAREGWSVDGLRVRIG